MKKISTFFANMDPKAFRAAMVLLGMFALVLGLILFARNYFELTEDGLSNLLAAVKTSPFALPFMVLIFTAAAFLGIPQWVLIGATVLTFGPVQGGLYSWVATMISASADFWLARFVGAQRLEALSGDFLERITRMVRKNGVLASFAVRLVPTGPFVLVNMAAGVSGLRYPAFMVGTGAGIIPKILLVALLAQGVLTRQQGEMFMLMIVLALAAVLLSMFFARRLLSSVVKED